MMTSHLPRSASTKVFALLSVCLAAAAMPLTFTGPAVALPAIARTLGDDPIALNWVTNAFMLTFGSTLMATGSLADTYGRKRVFLTGLAAFALMSLLAAAAPGILWFDLARALQGLAAAAAFSGGMASLAQEFDGAARLRAFSIVGTSFGVGLAFGPITSGLMIAAFGWPTIFFLVVGLATLGLAIGILALRETADPQASGLDWPGAISFTAALAVLTYAVLLAPARGWTDPLVDGLLVAALALFVIFARIERRVARPMLDLTLFRFPRFVGVQLLAAAPAYAFVVLLILLPVRFVGIERLSEIATGQMMMALSAPLLILPLVAGQLTRRLHPAVICGVGLVISAAGLFWLSRVPGGHPHLAIGAMLTIGCGISLPWGLMDGLAVSVVPKERAGMATGIFSTTRVAGEGIALAIVSAILSTLTAARLDTVPASEATRAAQRIVTGDLTEAGRIVPQLGAVDLLNAYGSAFSLLMIVLMAITILTAIVVFLFLGRGADTQTDTPPHVTGALQAEQSCG